MSAKSLRPLRLYDSSVWIEYLTDGERLEGKDPLFTDPQAILVSTMNLFEVGRYVERTSGPEVMEITLASLRKCRILPIDGRIATRAVGLAKHYKLHAANALIAATADLVEAELLTYDADLLPLPRARQP